MDPTLGGGTQDTDFSKGITKGNFTKHLRRRNGGGQGDPDPLISNPLNRPKKINQEKQQIKKNPKSFTVRFS